MNVRDICGAEFLPARKGHRGDDVDPIVCTASARDLSGALVIHRGDHRTTLPGGKRLRWSAEDVTR